MDTSDSIMGANVKTPPYEDGDNRTFTRRELIPVWVADGDEMYLTSIHFTFEVTETMTEDFVINVMDCQSDLYREDWNTDILDFIYKSYNNVQDVMFSI